MAILERIKKGKEVTVSSLLDEKQIVFLDSHTQEEALSTLIDCLYAQRKLSDKESFSKAIHEREKLVSTGIGIGVAIPHAKLEGFEDFFIAIGIQKNGGIEWNSLDGLPVKIIFMIGGPEGRQTDYLKILSLLTQAVRDEGRRKGLLEAKSPADVINVFEGF